MTAFGGTMKRPTHQLSEDIKAEIYYTVEAAGRLTCREITLRMKEDKGSALNQHPGSKQYRKCYGYVRSRLTKLVNEGLLRPIPQTLTDRDQWNCRDQYEVVSESKTKAPGQPERIAVVASPTIRISRSDEMLAKRRIATWDSRVSLDLSDISIAITDELIEETGHMIGHEKIGHDCFVNLKNALAAHTILSSKLMLAQDKVETLSQMADILADRIESASTGGDGS